MALCSCHKKYNIHHLDKLLRILNNIYQIYIAPHNLFSLYIYAMKRCLLIRIYRIQVLRIYDNNILVFRILNKTAFNISPPILSL